MSEIKDVTKPVDDDLDELLNSKSNNSFYLSVIKLYNFFARNVFS